MNYVAIGVAALAVFFLGWLWYGPLFGKRWLALSGIDEKKAKKAAKGGGMAWRMGLNLIANVVLVFVLAYLIELIGAPGITGGMEIAFWVWLGFIATNSLGHVLWENKPWGLWLLNNAYNLIGLLIAGGIIGRW